MEISTFYCDICNKKITKKNGDSIMNINIKFIENQIHGIVGLNDKQYKDICNECIDEIKTKIHELKNKSHNITECSTKE